MPLQPGSSPATISANIAEMSKTHPHDQSVAAALRMAHESAKRHRDFGGAMPAPSYFERQAFRQEEQPDISLIKSSGLGRVDIHNMDVPAGSYIIPADVVSGVGMGNTLAGVRTMEEAMSTGPYGTPLPRGARRDTIPAPPRSMSLPYPRYGVEGHDDGGAAGRKAGGTPEGEGDVPVVLAGGEVRLHPRAVARIGARARARNPKLFGKMTDVEIGHEVLDRWVVMARKRILAEMRKLPKPRKD